MLHNTFVTDFFQKAEAPYSKREHSFYGFLVNAIKMLLSVLVVRTKNTYIGSYGEPNIS